MTETREECEKLFDGNLDPEVRELVVAMNALPGIQTTESCCGHGRTPFRIWFRPENLDCLPRLLYWFDGCHCGSYGWQVSVTTDCGMSPASFVAEGPIGAYKEADHIAAFLRQEAAMGETEENPNG